MISRSRTHNRCDYRRPVQLEELDVGEGRNARATSFAQARICVSLSDSPSRITVLPEAPIAIIQQVKNDHVFAEPTFRQIVAPRNQKSFPVCAESVDDATSLWMLEEN